MKISFIIPSFTAKKETHEMLFNDCIQSLRTYNGDDHEIIVAEDFGTMANEVEQECQRIGVKYVCGFSNQGFSANVNRGVRSAIGDVLVLVNNDVRFTQNVVTPILESFSVDPKIGIVGALLLYPHGDVQHGGIVFNGGFSHRGWHRPLNQCSAAVHNPNYAIAVTGALMAIRRSMIYEVGLLNENYFLSCEDTEYCLRAWKQGWRVYYNSNIQAIHAEGKTRGSEHGEKLRYHREWYLKELETWDRFRKDIVKYDLRKIQHQVIQANVELSGVDIESITNHHSSPNSSPKSILLRRTAAMGDVVLMSGVIKRLKSENPGSQITVATLCGEVLKNNPYIHDVVRSCQGIRADLFYDLDLSYEMNPKLPVWESYSNTVFGDVLDSEKIEMFSGDNDYESMVTKLGCDLDKVVVVHMAVSWENRTWSSKSWLEVVKDLTAVGYQVVLVGQGADDRVSIYGNNVFNRVNVLNLQEIRELCLRAAAFIGSDSGLLHVAQTTDVPIVGLFTVADPKFRIVPRCSRTSVLIPTSSCRFCLHDKKPPVTFVSCRFGTNVCLTEITPAKVVKETVAIARQRSWI